MEQHVILVLTVTLTTPAYALLTTQDRIVTVSKHTQYMYIAILKHLFFRVRSLLLNDGL